MNLNFESRHIESHQKVVESGNSSVFSDKEEIAQLAARVLSDKVSERIYEKKESLPIIIDGFTYTNKALYSVLSQLNDKKITSPTIKAFKESLNKEGVFVSLVEGGKYSQTYSLKFENKISKSVTLIRNILLGLMIAIILANLSPNLKNYLLVYPSFGKVWWGASGAIFTALVITMLRSILPYKNKFEFVPKPRDTELGKYVVLEKNDYEEETQSTKVPGLSADEKV